MAISVRINFSPQKKRTPIVHFNYPFSTFRREKQTRRKNLVQQGKSRKSEMRLKNFLFCITLLVIFLQSINPSDEWPAPDSVPTPTPWPEQFHALLTTTLDSGSHLVSDFWYNWPKGRNVYLRQHQLGVHEYDIEWNNGTSFYYTVGSNATCEIIDFGVGIPRPDFLDGANYLGTQIKDGFLCNVWEKVGFIWYSEDVASKRPVRWDFSDGIVTHVMTFEVGVTVPDSIVQAPEYCFTAQKDV